MPDDVFDLDRIRELIELMKEHDLSEIDLRRDKQQIRLARQLGGSGLLGAVSPAGLAAMTASPLVATSTSPEPTGSHSTSNLATITSPMVGTFYTRPTPEAPPFVKVGDVVGPDTVLCIIEAMKVFNEIPAEASGQIVAILVKDQDAVEFGTPLFRIDPSGG